MCKRYKYEHLYINIHSFADSYIYKNIHDIKTYNDHTMTQKHTGTDIYIYIYFIYFYWLEANYFTVL